MHKILAPFLDYSYQRIAPGFYTMPNFSSDDPLLLSFEIKPKAAYLEHVTESNGECRQVNKFNVIQQLYNRSQAY